ncbi:MAG TPA: dephospho-CoA kinase [Chlamydiales bacterium]|nr:dephospho-CoA kinase [Chlamydiales bacterium]
MKKVAITGNLASGKTSALKIFKKLGAFVLSADEIIHQHLYPNFSIQKELEKDGFHVFEKGKLNKEKLSNLVFNDEKKLRKLEEIIHPYLLQYIKECYNKEKNKPYPMFVVEMPLLFEIHQEKLFDEIILMTCKETLAKKRYLKKDFDKRILLQLPPEKISDKATYIIENDFSKNDLEQQVTKIFDLIKKS